MDIHELIEKVREEAGRKKGLKGKDMKDVDKEVLNELLEKVKEHDEIARKRGRNSIKRLV